MQLHVGTEDWPSVYIPAGKSHTGVSPAGAELTGPTLSRTACMLQGGYRMRTSFLAEAEKHYLLGNGALQHVRCPVRILHGIRDTSVSPQVSQQLFAELPPGDHALTLLQVSRPTCGRNLLLRMYMVCCVPASDRVQRLDSALGDGLA